MLLSQFRYPLRSLIAIIIGLIIYKIINQPFSYWILLTIIVLLQSTTGATFFRTAQRVMGTLFGVLMGAMLIALVPYHPVLYYAIIFISLFLMIYFVVVSYQASMFFVGILLICVLSLLVSHGNQIEALVFASVRFLDTLIAGIIVISTTYLLWPDHTAKNVQKNFYTFLCACDQLVKELSINVPQEKTASGSIESFYKSISEFKKHANDAKFGLGDYVTKEQVLESMINNMQAIHSCFVTIAINQLTVVNIPHIVIADLHYKLEQFTHSLSSILRETQDFSQIHKSNLDWRNTVSMLLKLTEEISEYENTHGNVLSETQEGMRFAMLLINLRQICIDLQFIFTAVEQLRMR